MNEEGRGPKSPFFPSSADTNVDRIIPANFFMTSATCARCHTDIYEQWKSSTHHFSSFNNQWYRKSIEYMQDVDRHAAVEMVRRLPRSRRVLQRPLRPADQGTDRHARSAGRSRVHVVPFDHARRQHDGPGGFRRSNTRRCTISRRASNPMLRFLHDQLIRRSRAASRAFLKPFHRDQTAEFCSTCHKVHLDVPVNSYRWFRGFNDYDNWQASGVSGQGARSFYYPPKPRSAPTATCRWSRRTIRRRRTARFVAPVRGREHRAAVRQRRRRCSSRRSQDFLGTVRSRSTSSASRASPRPRRRGRRMVSSRSRALASTFARRRGVGELRRRRRVLRAARRSDRAARQGRRGGPSRRIRRGSRSSCAPARSVISSRAARWTPSTSGSSSKRSTSRAARLLHSGAVADEGQGRSSRARISIAACSSTRTATRSTSATPGRRVGRLRAPDSAGRGRHDALPAADSRGRRQTGSRCARR